MKSILMTGAACVVLFAGAQAQELVLKNVVANVTITTGGAFDVRYDAGESDLERPDIDESRDRVVIETDLRANGCNSNGFSQRIKLRRREDVKVKDLPTLTITVPDNTRLTIDDGVLFGEAGDMGAANVDIGSCSEFAMGRIGGDAELDISGAGDFKARDVTGALDLDVSGAGDVEIGDVGAGAAIDVSGAGDVTMGRIGGSVEIDLSGAADLSLGDVDGDVTADLSGSADVKGDNARAVRVDVSGSASARFARIADLTASVSGAGDVRVDHAEGAMDFSVSGSGDVDVDEGRATSMKLRGDGGGSIRFGGDAETLDVRLGGGADARIKGRVGAIERQDVSRGADLRIGG